MNKIFFLLIFVFTNSFGQNLDIDSLKIGASAIINSNHKSIQITAFDKMLIKEKRIITVFNSDGLSYIDAHQLYNKNISIKDISVTIISPSGKELKKIKKKDFKDYSATNSSTFVSDDRILALSYTPTEYPFTAIIESEVEYKTTAFIPRWLPVTGYDLAIIKDEFELTNTSGIKLNFKENNLDKYVKVNKRFQENYINYSVENVSVLDKEDMMPSALNILPYVDFSLETFELEGVKGEAKDWSAFGKWMYQDLLIESNDLPQQTKDKMNKLVEGIENPIEKAKKVYEYVQNTKRYISIQLGIGGWKPMKASEVDKLGYGDCKALTNYTKALLEAVNIPSYYTVVYGSSGEKKDIQPDFVAMQGNHVILTMPYNGQNYFIECTSQTSPLTYKSNFTDDRFALKISENGGEILKTGSYATDESKQQSTAEVYLFANGALKVNAEINSTGSQYEKAAMLKSFSKGELDKYYKNYFDFIHNLKLNQTDVNENKELINLTEKLSFETNKYSEIYGSDLIFCPNVLNRQDFLPKRIKNRKYPFQVLRGYLDIDNVVINLPEGYTLEGLPNSIIEKSKFGEYEVSFKVLNESKIEYSRKFIVFAGTFENTDYEEYRKFREKILKSDNIKILLKK